MEDITKSWNNLSLNEREGLDLTLQNKLRSFEFIIAAKFLTWRAWIWKQWHEHLGNYGDLPVVLKLGTSKIT